MRWRERKFLSKCCLWIGECSLVCAWSIWTVLRIGLDWVHDGYWLALIVYGGVGLTLAVTMTAQAWNTCRIGLGIRRDSSMERVLARCRSMARWLPVVVVVAIVLYLMPVVIEFPGHVYAFSSYSGGVLFPVGTSAFILEVLMLALIVLLPNSR